MAKPQDKDVDRPEPTVSERIAHCLESYRPIEPFLLTQLSSLEHMTEQIDEAFGGHPFLPDEAATSPRNLRRVSRYLELRNAVLTLYKKVIDLWTLIHGMSPKTTDVWLYMLWSQAQEESRPGDSVPGKDAGLQPGGPPTVENGGPFESLEAWELCQVIHKDVEERRRGIERESEKQSRQRNTQMERKPS